MKKIWYMIAVIAMFGMVFFYPQSACGEGNTQDETTTINFLNGSSEKIDYYDGSCRTDERTSVYVLAQIIMPVGTEEAELSIKTSKNSIVSIPVSSISLKKDDNVQHYDATGRMDYYYNYNYYDSYCYGGRACWRVYLCCDILKSGVGAISFTVGDVTVSKDIVVRPEPYVGITKISQISHNQMKIVWQKETGCSGYLVQRFDKDFNKRKTIKVVEKEGTTTAILNAEWEKTHYYYVVPYVVYKGQRILAENDTVYTEGIVPFTMGRPKSKLVSVAQKNSDSLKIQWKKIDGAKRYKLYRSEKENGTYKCVYTTNSKNSYTQKVTKGKQYYYYVKAEFEEGWATKSDSLTGLVLLKNGKLSKKEQSVNQQYEDGRYGINTCAASDKTYYYESKGKLYMVSLQKNGKLKLYTMEDKTKCTFYKDIKLPKYEIWGGFYQGPDGNFYVAVGYSNPKESDKKIVIKVLQYDSKWKLKKTCNIRGNATNKYKGIYDPFNFSGCSMTMQGTTLYLATARKMYKLGDGLRHQSNIGFQIDTKKMTYKCNSPYVSHSFNQLAKFKDGNLYQVDHGDGFPRAVVLSIKSNYGTTKEKEITKNLFEIKGQTGQNYTGVYVGGMEVGEKNVMVCGTAKPHKYKIKGTSGYKSDLKNNVFLLTADRNSGKSKVIWLTKYDPKKSDVTVSETRMVKLTDNRFAILYSTNKNNKNTLHYVVVDNQGKKIAEKTYKNIWFAANSDPVLYKGYIRWVSHTDYWGWYLGGKSVYYKVPVTW